MITHVRFGCLLALGLIVSLGCGGGENRPQAGGGLKPVAPSAEGIRFVLAAEPAGVKDVVAARKETKDGDDVVLVGRIGGEKKAMGKNAIFTIVDLSLSYCPEEENCPTPWDYCCTPKEDLRGARATVKFEAEPGKTHPQDAKQLLGVKELDVVVVKGKAKRDEAGNLVVLGDGLFVRERYSAPKQ